MVDVHSHIIPGIDDGAIDADMALEMLKTAVKDGTSKIVATPHYCSGFAETPYVEVNDLTKKLNALAKSEGIDIEIYHGQEVYYNKNIIRDYNEGLIGTINNSDYMLIELPMNQFSKNTLNVLYELKILGVKIILAHPERYHPIIKSPSQINDFLNEGFILQMNAGSICGDFGKDVKRTCEILLDNRVYSLIGSDAHNTTYRNVVLSSAVNIIKQEYREYTNIFDENGNSIIHNEEVKFEGQLVEYKKSFFDFVKRR